MRRALNLYSYNQVFVCVSQCVHLVFGSCKFLDNIRMCAAHTKCTLNCQSKIKQEFDHMYLMLLCVLGTLSGFAQQKPML